MNASKKKQLKLLGVGFTMGSCDVVPGISGGTVAFLSGIYEELLFTLKSEATHLGKFLSTGQFKEFKKIFSKKYLAFLIPLFLGIGIALLSFSRVIKYVLDSHYLFTMSFFLTMIAYSAVLLYHKQKQQQQTTSLLVGILLGVLFLFLRPTTITPTIPYLFLSGMIAITAMFLPGISGSFLLLLLGVYEYALGLLHHPFDNLFPLVVFCCGLGVGALISVFTLSYYLKKYEARALSFLFGLLASTLLLPLPGVINEFQASSFSLKVVYPFFILLLVLLLYSSHHKIKGVDL